jgi:hypothetical protein
LEEEEVMHPMHVVIQNKNTIKMEMSKGESMCVKENIFD